MVVDEMLGGGIQVFSYFAKVMCDIITFTKKKKKKLFFVSKMDNKKPLQVAIISF